MIAFVDICRQFTYSITLSTLIHLSDMTETKEEKSMNGNSGVEMVPFLHLTDKKLMKRTTTAMQRRGTAACFRPLAELTPEEIPPWVESDKGGWILFLERSKMDTGSSRLGLMMSFETSISPRDEK